ncbi:MAG: ECF transporter S component [Clostridia bacterium]|nr:ECF transporter S component [Clostridia bacterium]MBR3553322.1 ECF transporter S component [Clostridia bacterium]
MKTTETAVQANQTPKSQAAILKLVTVSMLSAVSFVLFLFEFPIIPGMEHLKIDLSDIPALVGALLFGPWWGVLIELIKNALQLLVRGMGSQMGFGNIMNFLVGCAYIVPFTFEYRYLTKYSIPKIAALIHAAVLGMVAIVGVGIVGNYLIDPPFFKYVMNIELTSEMLWPAIWSATALNAIKGGLLTVVSFPLLLVLMDRLKKILRRPA